MNQFRCLFNLATVAITASVTAAQIDVIGTLAPLNSTVGSGVNGVRALTTSQTWTANNEYFLTDRVFIPNGITLTIEPGTKIYGSVNDSGTPGTTTADKADDKVGSLVTARGGRLVAEGTAAAPIIFTSVREWEVANNQDSPFDPGTAIGPAPTKADAGQWGGIVMLGNAYINHLNGTTGNVLGYAAIEGFVPNSTPSDDGDTVPDAIQYGFASSGPFIRDDEDDSGVLRYVSIRHGGYEFDAGREINGLTLAGVGAGTVIDHVEVYANQDDGIEFFGGTVSTSHILLAYNQDDNFDLDSGHTGVHQFWFSVAEPGIADGGFEADGIEGTTATQAAYDAAFSDVANKVLKTPAVGTAAVVLSKPVIYNATIVGPGRTNTFSTIAVGTGQVLTEKGNHAFIFDDYFNGEVFNSVFDDFAQDLAFFRDNAKAVGATARVAHNTIGRFGTGAYTGTAASNNTLITNTNSNNLFFNSLSGLPTDSNSNGSTDPQLTTYTRNGSNVLTAIDPRPASNSPLLKANGATLKSGAPVPVSYRGAFGSSNWAAGWTKFSSSGILQGPGEGGGSFADADGDGITDALETANTGLGLNPAVSDASTVLPTLKTTAQFNANFTSGQNSVTSNPGAFGLYDETSILDLRTVGQTMVQKVGGNVTLTVPVEKSTGLNTWGAAGNMTLGPFTGDPTKEFYRLKVEGAQ
jgi:hypothetical protein